MVDGTARGMHRLMSETDRYCVVECDADRVVAIVLKSRGRQLAEQIAAKLTEDAMPGRRFEVLTEEEAISRLRQS